MITDAQFSELLSLQKRMERRLDEIARAIEAKGSEEVNPGRRSREELAFFARNPQEMKRAFGGRKK